MAHTCGCGCVRVWALVGVGCAWQDVHGKQLMCECLYLYGTMLLLLERHLPGDVRERMVIAVMRHQPEVRWSAVVHREKSALHGDTGDSFHWNF